MPPKPRPRPTSVTRPFWDGLNHDQVRLQRCQDCHSWVWYPRLRCHRCLSSDLTWRTVAGTGTLYTFSVARQATSPHFADEVPQLLAVVELDEGVRITSTIVDARPEDLAVGRRVEPVFDHGADGVTLLRYRLA